MHFAYWRYGDNIQLLSWVMEEWQKVEGTIDNYVMGLGFATPWDKARWQDNPDPTIIAIYASDAHESIAIGPYHSRFAIIWENSDDNFGLFFAATPFDMFAIVREIHDYEKHMANTLKHRYSSK